jgi:hypothetical protein
MDLVCGGVSLPAQNAIKPALSFETFGAAKGSNALA